MENMIVPDVRYALTINPKRQYRTAGQFAFRYAYSDLFDRLIGLMTFGHFQLWLEYSPATEPGKGGKLKDFFPRLHGHGYITFTKKGVIAYYTHRMEAIARIGVFSIRPLTEGEDWSKYCNKNEAVMDLICKADKVPRIIENKTYRNKKLVKEMKGWYCSANKRMSQRAVEDLSTEDEEDKNSGADDDESQHGKLELEDELEPA